MASAYVSRHSIRGEAVLEMWTKHSQRYTGSLGRIADARDLLIGRMKAPLPEVIAKRPDAEAFRVSTSQKYTSVMQLVNKLSSPDPRLMRPKLGSSDLQERNSSRIEKFINPAIRRNLSNRDLTELMTVEGEGAGILVPISAAWRKVAGSYYEKDGATIKQPFQRDAKGTSYDDALEEHEGDEERTKKEFEPDEKRSRAVYDAHVKHMRARNFPFEIRLLSRQQMVPINPVIRGNNVDVDGLLVRTYLTRDELIRRKYVWKGMNDHLEPTTEEEGNENGFALYEAWLTDQDETTGELYPYVAYSVAGKPSQNSRAGFETDAVIDLHKQCGLRSLPCVYGYGWRWFTVNPDDRAIPYTFPFGKSWLALDAFLTGKTFAGWSEGMLAWFMRMPDTIKDTATQQAWNEFVDNHPLTIEPFKILPVWGDMIPAVHPGTGHDINDMAMALKGDLDSELVNPLARGGGQAASAIERSVVSADTVSGLTDVTRTVDNMTRRLGELGLEVCAGYARKHNQSVFVYGNPDTPNDARSNESPTLALIELKPQWLGPEGEESYDLVAFRPKSLGDNLAEKAQAFGFYKEGAITFEQWCSEIGVEDPERYRAQLIFDQWIMKTPEGQQVAMADAAKYLNDKELVALFEAQKSGAAGPQGQPIGMVAGLNPPMPGGPVQSPDGQAAVQMQDPAASQAAAIAGAGRQADAAAVGPPPAMAGSV